MDHKKIVHLCIPETMSVKDCIQRLTETGEKILFVIDSDKRSLGTITDGDIRRGIINGYDMSAPASKIMHRDFFFVEKDGDILTEAKKLMQKHVIDHVPVLDAERRLVEVIQWVDYIKEESPESSRTKPTCPVVIMAGGKGTRMEPFTKIIPKPLIPVRDKPILQYILDRYHAQGFSDFLVVVNYKKEMIKSYFSENEFPYSIKFVDETEFLGTAGGLTLLRNEMKSSFIVANCDSMLNGDYSELLEWHQEKKNLFTLVGSHREIAVPYGVLTMKDGFLSQITEKPTYDLFVNTGTYVMEPEVFSLMEDSAKLDMDELIRKIQTRQGNRLGVFPHWGDWLDIGQWDEYKKTLRYLGEY